MEHKKKKLTGQQGELMRALDISVDDLMANDDGYISDDQRESVIKRQGYQWKEYRNASIIMLLFALLVSLISFINIEGMESVALVIGVFLLSFAGIFGTLSFMKHRSIKNDISSNSFQTVQGIAVVNLNGSKSNLEINGMKLDASADVLRRVQNLAPYRVHYLPNSKVILSMEHIEDDRNIRQDADIRHLQDTDNSTVSVSNYEPATGQGSQSS